MSPGTDPASRRAEPRSRGRSGGRSPAAPAGVAPPGRTGYHRRVTRLYNKQTGALIGPITDDQLRDLIDLLVEESADDRDYYVDRDTLDYLEENQVDAELLALLRKHVPEEGEGIDIEWRDEPA
ncbi:hypothetical protein SAMN02745121_09140 [Nannocystis exedens]|uniref:Galactosyldiacylglycerol synthase n=1 Tax=Nannocystis exedens TaxID=54 RepID=A0A1I2J394_9BACT|nr:galactosyldiacylglycerol synthase [Nannocystis exedens]SFF48480.1 hypothetical protein SAMN02745121_09140 [Nannocystis exedens]